MDTLRQSVSSAAAFLSGNPFSTLIGSKIERATDPSVKAEDWALNMEICDLINATEEGPRDAVKAIRKRLTNNAGKNQAVLMYTLEVLETCVKNCDIRFHMLVCSREFVNELVKLIGPKNDPPVALQEKVLAMVQTWADAFGEDEELFGVGEIYRELKDKGVEFPMTNLDEMAPIRTPQRTTAYSDPTPIVPAGVEVAPFAGDAKSSDQAHSQPRRSLSSFVRRPHGDARALVGAEDETDSSAVPVPVPDASQVRSDGDISADLISATRLNDLRAHLNIVLSNIRTFGHVLDTAKCLTGREDTEPIVRLLEELNATCKQMQQRIVELIERISNEEMIEELLRVNDDLNNVFVRYERFCRQNQKQQEFRDEQPKEASASTDLITLDAPGRDVDTKDITVQLTDIDLSAPPVPQRTDYSAGQSAAAQFDGVSQALHARTDGGTSGQTELKMSSSEFDQFLSERAAQSGGTDSTQADATQSKPPTANRRTDDDLFGL